MGDVYVAEDTRLDRRVALKVPRLEKSAAVDRLVRFQREAKAAAALNHPNIVHLDAVEEAEGLVFMTMELVQGTSLRQLLSGRSPLTLQRTLSFASQIADALACAHAAGVLHRDLTPANVMITNDERVKILDFGVATFFKPDIQAVTKTHEGRTSGEAVGTIGYMSPEQALGKPLDARADLFALGVILFEMATGRVPFAGDTPAMVFDQLLNQPPRSALLLNPYLPAQLVTIVDKALEKDPERRYRSAQDLLEALNCIEPAEADARPRSVAASASQAHVRHSAPPVRLPATAADVTTERMPTSIVVLPFVDMSPRKDQEYFCHGITEEIINSLTRVPGLRVISRTSAFAFHGKDLDVTEIGRRLRVGTALEGSVRKAGERVRVTAQLVDAEDGYQLWSKRFDRDLSDVFAIQDEIAATIMSEFQLGSAAAPGRRVSFDVSAHDAYLRGMHSRNKWTDDSMRRAIIDFREAIAQDPGFAPAYAALAEAHLWLYSGLGVLPAHETVPHARAAVDKALELDPTLADGYKVRGLIAMDHDWDRKAAEKALTQALKLGPGSAAAHLWNAWRLALLEKQHERALIELDEAERLDPLDLQSKTQIGYVHYFHHDFDRAIAQFERVVTLEPSFAFAHYALGDACTQTGQYDRAIREFNLAIELGGRSVNHVAVLGYAYGRSGNRARAEEHLQELITRATQTYVSAMWIAMIHLGLGDLDNLFRWLDRAFADRDGSLILITAAVEFDPVRNDPRFKSLLGRMGLGHLA